MLNGGYYGYPPLSLSLYPSVSLSFSCSVLLLTESDERGASPNGLYLARGHLHDVRVVI